MTPKQKELLVEALQSDYVSLKGSGEHAAVKAMHRKGWITSDYSVNRSTITQEGKDALRLHSKPAEIFDNILLIDGRPVARIINGQTQRLEEFLADQDL
ncbi:hypothetical protein [Aquibium oceanicum]|uniref:Uncharacterized protein n=1 Tax=Aquibium oceanicum TaxID=1670800 RepID=A0A1L3SXP8_9HYPH|nr:hypothetical protein [Aquibium oceanicum]APH74124.1 hypothetical protein BSQ44_24205 [Aquibium oceanicum]